MRGAIGPRKSVRTKAAMVEINRTVQMTLIRLSRILYLPTSKIPTHTTERKSDVMLAGIVSASRLFSRPAVVKLTAAMMMNVGVTVMNRYKYSAHLPNRR